MARITLIQNIFCGAYGILGTMSENWSVYFSTNKISVHLNCTLAESQENHSINGSLFNTIFQNARSVPSPKDQSIVGWLTSPWLTLIRFFQLHQHYHPKLILLFKQQYQKKRCQKKLLQTPPPQGQRRFISDPLMTPLLEEVQLHPKKEPSLRVLWWSCTTVLHYWHIFHNLSISPSLS